MTISDQPIPFHCRCGAVQGVIDPAGVYLRATCYCRDCQAFTRVLGCEDVRKGVRDNS